MLYQSIFIGIFFGNICLLGSEEKLITEACGEEAIMPKLITEVSGEKAKGLLSMYAVKPWHEIVAYHKKYAFSFDVQMNYRCHTEITPLLAAIFYKKPWIVNSLLEEKKVDATFTRVTDRRNALHYLMDYIEDYLPDKGRYNQGWKDPNKFKYLVENLVKNGCDINALSQDSFTPLEEFLRGRVNSTYSEVLIENGALLMVKQGDKRWNTFDNDIDWIKNIELKKNSFWNPTEEDLRTLLEGIINSAQGLLFSKCKYDYESYKKNNAIYFIFSLICKRFRTETKKLMPKPLIKYIVEMVTQKSITHTPVDHIEETLIDTWKYNGSDPKEYIRINRLLVPHLWREQWNDYKSGKDRTETNFIVQACAYKGYFDTKN